ncbi:MAG TPA: EamA family transporter [Gaiellaceae bacterium]|nr:EamA family transporter [Gaiellaceae bacterium]
MSPKTRVWVALWAVYLIWGSTYLGIKLAGETIPPIFAASIRFIAAGALMAAFVAWRRGARLLLPGRAAFLSAAAVGVLLPSANALLFVAERHVPIGTASLVIGSVPLWIVLLRLATGDRPTRRSLGAVVVGFAGLAILVRPGGGTSVGWLALVVCSALAWALGSFLSSRLPMPADAFAATALEMLVGGLFLLPFGLVFHGSESLNPADFSTRSILGWVYLVLFGSLVGYTAYVWLLGHAPIGTVATYAYVNPVVAIVLGVVFLGETVTWTIAAAAAVILVSVAVVIRQEAASVIEPFAE